jgi:hypothetical protein
MTIIRQHVQKLIADQKAEIAGIELQLQQKLPLAKRRIQDFERLLKLLDDKNVAEAVEVLRQLQILVPGR